MERTTVKVTCELCNFKKKCGPGIYEGRNVPAWGVWICNSCRKANAEGIVLANYPGFRAKLNENGIEIVLNSNGYVDIPKPVGS